MSDTPEFTVAEYALLYFLVLRAPYVPPRLLVGVDVRTLLEKLR